MLLIAIIDDDDYVCSQVEEYLRRISLNYDVSIEVDIYNSGEAFQRHLCDGDYYDVIFLDIEMSGMSGLDVSRILREMLGNEATQIVYISGKTEYAIDVFDYDPIHFLPKPLTEQLVEKAFQKILRKLNIKAEAFSYKVGTQINKIPIKNIIYFESEGRKVKVHFQGKINSFYGSLDKVQRELKMHDFILM